MKKNKLTNLLKFGILFFGISLFLSGCEKEELIPIEVSSKIIPQKMSLSEAKKNKDFTLISEKFKLKPYLNENSFVKKSNDFTIDFNSFYEIKKENYTSYTFLLKRSNKDNTITENLVVEKKNDTIRGYIVKYSDVFYKKSGTNLFLNAKTSRTYFKGDIEKLLELNNIKFHNKGGWSCSWNTTYTLRVCGNEEHGAFNSDNPACGNYGKSNWISSSYQTCSYSSNEPTLSESSGNEIDFSYGGGSRGYDNSETVPIIPCSNGEESLQNNNIAPDCIEILEEEEDEQIVNNLTGKAKCVFDKLEGNDLRNKTIERFDGEKAPVNLILELDDIANPNVGGETSYGDSYNITITLDNDYMNNTPSLFVALIILHEAIHADIYRKIKITSGLYYNSTTMKWELPNGSEVNFPTLFDYYNDYPDNPHHNYMADYYRNAMEQGLRDYANSNGLTFPDQLFKDLSWGGLEGTNAWKNMFADPIHTQNEQRRIKNVILTFKNSSNNGC